VGGAGAGATMAAKRNFGSGCASSSSKQQQQQQQPWQKSTTAARISALDSYKSNKQ